MKRILVVYYSQTGQLGEILQSIVEPLRASNDCSVMMLQLKPKQPYPFPWSFWRFFNTFPECIYDDPGPVEKLNLADDAEFDLVILGYQVWFISPSLPTTAGQTTLARQTCHHGDWLSKHVADGTGASQTAPEKTGCAVD